MAVGLIHIAVQNMGLIHHTLLTTKRIIGNSKNLQMIPVSNIRT